MAEIPVRLVLRTLPAIAAEDGPLDVGLQDKTGAVRSGRPGPEGALLFEATIRSLHEVDALDFRGPYVHGRPGERFLYLGWKRRKSEGPPWLQRVKVPLAGVPADLVRRARAGEGALQADVTGRRPHETTPIDWILGLA